MNNLVNELNQRYLAAGAAMAFVIDKGRSSELFVNFTRNNLVKKPVVVEKPIMNKKLIVLAMASLFLTGCASTMSGLGESSSSFSCKAPEGVTCTSVTGIYANAAQHNLPALTQAKNVSDKTSDKTAKTPSYYGDKQVPLDPTSAVESNKMPPIAMNTPQSGDPIRSQPLTLRIWLAPWIDADGDLHDQRYIYTTVHNGEWLIEANQAAIKDRYKAVSISRRALDVGKNLPTENGPTIAETLANPQRTGNEAPNEGAK